MALISSPQEDGVLQLEPTQASAQRVNKPDLCMTLCNHWSYTGIGWTLGLESCAQSIRDSLEMADYQPSVKTGINLDAYAYELVGQHYPHLIKRLRKYLNQGLVEIIGGTFGQPLGTTVSGESNLRHLVYGQRTIQTTLGRRVAVFLEEEEMSHPQIPQLLALSGYRYASMAQCDTWGKHGAPHVEKSIIWWEGVDGSKFLTASLTDLVFHPPVVTQDIDWLWGQEGRLTIEKMNSDRVPLAIKWTEFGWENLTGQAMNKFDPELFKTLSDRYEVEYVTVEQYLDRYTDAGAPIETVQLAMDDFSKLLAWGIGGDQVRRFGRNVEAILATAERIEAVASALGLTESSGGTLVLDDAWRNLLMSQSHDVALCEYSRVQGSNPPENPIFEQHFQTWGSRGFDHMDKAAALGRQVLARSLSSVASAVDTNNGDLNSGQQAALVFNASGCAGDNFVTTRRLNLEDWGGASVQVLNAQGEVVPSQILSSETDEGHLVSVEVGFVARDIPGLGYDTYYLTPSTSDDELAGTGLIIEENEFLLENEFVRVTLDPCTGAISGLIDLRSDNELLSAGHKPFPTLTGQPNGQAVPVRHSRSDQPNCDSSNAQAEFFWLEKGPVRSRVRAIQSMDRGMKLETTTTLYAHSPAVEVQVRFFPNLPPVTGEGNINGWQFPLEIEAGYWLNLAPAFEPYTIVRDYPFGIEACSKKVIDALSFLDLLSEDGSGLLVAHSGTQYWKRLDDGTFTNLILREWESHFLGEYGWPRVGIYRYLLMPHDAEFSNLDRLQTLANFDLKPQCVVVNPQSGSLPKRNDLMQVEGALLSAFHRSTDAADSYELRIFECEGKPSQAQISTSLPLVSYIETDALGQAKGEIQNFMGSATIALQPWKIRNFQFCKESSQS